VTFDLVVTHRGKGAERVEPMPACGPARHLPYPAAIWRAIYPFSMSADTKRASHCKRGVCWKGIRHGSIRKRQRCLADGCPSRHHRELVGKKVQMGRANFWTCTAAGG